MGFNYIQELRRQYDDLDYAMRSVEEAAGLVTSFQEKTKEARKAVKALEKAEPELRHALTQMLPRLKDAGSVPLKKAIMDLKKIAAGGPIGEIDGLGEVFLQWKKLGSTIADKEYKALEKRIAAWPAEFQKGQCFVNKKANMVVEILEVSPKGKLKVKQSDRAADPPKENIVDGFWKQHLTPANGFKFVKV